MLRNCLSALLNSLSSNISGKNDSPKRKRQKAVSYSRSLRFEPCEDRTMLSVSPFNSEDVTALWTFDVNTEDTNGAFVGTLNNGASLTTNGIAGGGLSLDGVDDYFSIGDPEELQIVNEITLAAWIVPETASGTQNIIAKGYSTNPNGEIFLRIANGKYQVGSWTGSNHMAEFTIPSSDIGERVHLAGTYDGTTWRLYRNGVEIASTVDNIGAVEVDGAWAVGARGTGTERFYSGVIDEVVISSSVYTAQEIAALASIQTNAQEDNSVTWNWSDVQSGELYSEQGDSLGTLSNGAYIQTDLNYGQVLNLSGNNGYVSLGNPDDLQIHGEITLSAWICPNSLNGVQNIIAKGHSSNPNGEIFLRIANGEYQVGSWNGTNYYASAIADTDDIGQWIQLTGVYDGTAWRLYKNGVLAASLSSTVGAVPVSADWSIGSNGSGSTRFFNGKIGNGGIYDHALDAQSVAALMTDSQTTARVGGNSYAIKDQSYVLQLEASHPDVLWTVNWGDGTTDEYYNASSASHIYTHYGTSGVSVTAKRNGQTIDVAGSSISLQIGSVDEMIINGNFEDVAIPNGTYWAIYDTIPGWTGPVEIQINNGSKVAELDTDSRYSDLDPSVSDHQPHHTTITSYQMDFTPGLTYTLSFDAWNRSDYAQDNKVQVTIPGTIVYINDDTSVSELLDLIDDNANLSAEENVYAFTSISTSTIAFSAGGSYYETDDGNGGTAYTLGASPFHVSSITFVATSNSGSVSFSDVSSDVIPGYGPLLDNISMNQEYLYVDIDVDSNNDGVINAFDDPVEMAPNGGKILAVGYGQCKPINLSVHTNQTNLASDNIVYQLEYDNSKILLYNTAELPQAVYGTEIDISPYYIAPNTDLPNGFLTLDGSIKTIYVDGFVLGETTVMLKAYSVYSNSSGNTVRELISSDGIKLNVGFDLDTDSNENGTIDYAYNFALSTGKLSVRPHVEDMVEDLAGYGCTLVTGSSTNVKISKREIEIPEGCQLQLIISAGLTGYTYWENGQLPGLHNPSSLIDDTLGEVYTVSSDFPDNFCVQCGDLDNNAPVERTIHLRLVRTSDNAILARDTIRFNCVPYELDLRVDINDNGFTEIDDNLNEDDDDYTGFLIPYGDHYNENVTQEQIHNIDDAHIFVFLPPNANKTEWDNKYIRLCQVNSDREIVQVLGVYQLGDTNVFFWNANSSCYQITDLTFIAEESSKNSYEAWVRAELYDTLPADNTIQTGNKTLKIHDLNSSPALNLSTDSMLASDLIKMTATLFVMDRKTTYVVNGNKYAGRTSSSDIDNDHVIDQVQDQKFKWICNLKDGTYETPVTGGKKINYNNENGPAVSDNGKGDSYLRSALSYKNTGFVMDLDYSFVAYPGKDNSIDQYGYVQAQNKDKPDDKLSFVSNGGIKFGSVDGYGDGVYEVAILDVKNMIHKFFNKTNILDSDFSDLAQKMINPSNNTTISYNNVSYTWEKYSKLLNGIGYGQLNINGSNDQEKIDNLKQYLIDTYNLLDTTNNMILTTESCSSRYSSVSVVTNDEETFSATVHEWEKDNKSYHTDYISAGDGYLYLQSHWGSGVIYTINSLIPNNNNGGNNGNN